MKKLKVIFKLADISNLSRESLYEYTNFSFHYKR